METASFCFAALVLGMIVLVIGVIFRVFQPRRINRVYGYRTNASMRSLNAWRFANRYAAKLIILLGVGLSLLGLIGRSFPALRKEYAFAAVMLGVLGFALVVLLTEKRLKDQAA